MRTEPMIAVRDVVASSKWYQQLLGCRSNHGGAEFDELVQGDSVLLLLHHWGAPEHPSMLDPQNGRIGHGLVLYFRVENLSEVYSRARELRAQIVAEPVDNLQAHQREFSLRDPDGYLLTICAGKFTS